MNKELTRPELAIVEFFTTFLRENWRRLPAWARATTYFVLLLFFCITAYRYTAGDFVIPGRVFVKQANGLPTPAINHDVHVGERNFGTNSKGEYFVVLPAVYYYLTLVNHSMDLTIDDSYGPLDQTYPTKFQYLTRDFADIKVLPRADTRAGTPTSSKRISDDLVPAAYANAIEKPIARPTARPTDRLFVEQVVLAKDANTNSATLELNFNRKETDLLTFGQGAGKVPLIAGEAVDFGDRYYLPLPQKRSPSFDAKVELDSGGFWPFSYSEDFKIERLPVLGQTAIVLGEKGSKLIVRLMSPIDVAITTPSSLADGGSRVRSELLHNGVRVMLTPSASGKAPNWIRVGRSIPEDVVSSVIASLRQNGFQITKDMITLSDLPDEQYSINVEYSELIDSVNRMSPEEAGRVFDQLHAASGGKKN